MILTEKKNAAPKSKPLPWSYISVARGSTEQESCVAVYTIQVVNTLVGVNFALSRTKSAQQ